MTRYARARGSKASNERIPEHATPWCVLKQQLEEQTAQNTKAKVVATNNVSDSCNTHKNTEVKSWENFDGHSAAASGENNGNSKLNVKIKKQKCNLIKLDKHVVNNCSKLLIKTKGNAFAVSAVHSDKEIKSGCTNNFSETPSADEVNISGKKPVKRLDVSNLKEESLSEPTNRKLLNQRQKRFPENPIKRKKIEPEEGSTLNKNEEADGLVQNNTHFSKNMERNNNTQFKRDNKDVVRNKNANFQNRHTNFNRVRPPQTMFINGKVVEIKNFMGFPIRKEDAERLYDLRRELKSNGVPRSKIERILQGERRNAEKSLAREKKVVCYKCRKYGHNLADCPESGDPSGICFKCGSTEHSVSECRVVRGDSFKFAHCFICQEQGHISRQCPDNPRGLYPKGGACKVCGDVTHLRKDCPDLVTEKENSSLTVGMGHNSSIEGLDEDLTKTNNKNVSKKTAHVKF